MIQLLPNRRYLFTQTNGETFRATVIDVLCRESSDYKTLRLKHYERADGTRMNGMVTMPYDWIEKADTLDDVLKGEICLPSEILLEIDDFN